MANLINKLVLTTNISSDKKNKNKKYNYLFEPKILSVTVLLILRKVEIKFIILNSSNCPTKIMKATIKKI